MSKFEFEKEDLYIDMVLKSKMPNNPTIEKMRVAILSEITQLREVANSTSQVCDNYLKQYKFINNTYKSKFKQMSEMYKKYVVNAE